MGFKELGLSDGLLRAVAEAGYSEPTPIQAQAIPQALMGRDVLGIAQTGTGKTASFTLPLIDILSEGRARARMPRTLILEPTRELAAQVSESFEKYGKNARLSMALLIGGVNFADQEKKLDRGVDVLIATPGRLLDHFERGKLLLNGIDILVIDEADRMLDMGFIPDVEKICSKITKSHQTLFFSATMPPPIEKLVKTFLNDPKIIEIARASSTASTITQSLVAANSRQKRATLRNLIERETIKNGIIFCNRKRDVSEVYESLKRHRYSVGQLHGDMAQSDRLAVLDQFKKNELQLLVASDVAARGLDIPDVSHVFNFDVPSHAEDYVHRIGRTGRAGREGRAFTFVSDSKDDAKYLNAILKLIGDQVAFEPGFEPNQKTDAKPSKAAKSDNGPSSAEATEKAPRQPRRRTQKESSNSRQAKTNQSDMAEPDNSTPPLGDQRAAPERAKNKHRSENKSDNPAQTDAERPLKEQNNQDGRKDNRHQPRAKSSSYNERSHDKQRYDRSDRYQQDEPVVGLGDHVPAFLQRPPTPRP